MWLKQKARQRLLQSEYRRSEPQGLTEKQEQKARQRLQRKRLQRLLGTCSVKPRPLWQRLQRPLGQRLQRPLGQEQKARQRLQRPLGQRLRWSPLAPNRKLTAM